MRTAAWPTDPLAVETLAGQIVGDELFMRVSTRGVTGVYPFQWMAALVEATSAALQAAITAGHTQAEDAVLASTSTTPAPRTASRRPPRLAR